MRHVRPGAFIAAAVLLLGIAVPAQAQDESDAAAYLALIWTPTAAVPPVLSAAMLDRADAGTSFTTRYGYMDFFGSVGIHTLVVGAEFGRSPSTRFGVTGGFLYPNCDGCDGHLLLGGNVQSRLTSRPIGDGSARLNVGLDGAVGFGKPEDASLLSASLALPLALVSRSGTLTVAPFISPGLGIGYISGDGGSEQGVRPMLGAGLAVAGAGGVAFHFGMQKVFIEDGDLQFGLGVSWGGRK